MQSLAFTESTQGPISVLAAAPGRPALWRVGVRHGARADVEAFIRDRFARRYGASLGDLAEVLYAVVSSDGRIMAAAGVREARPDDQARGQPLFLERYLDAPVEALLGRALGRSVARDSVVEVSSLAGVRGGTGALMILLLADHFETRGLHYLACTATCELRKLFARLDLFPLTDVPASPTAAGDELWRWGSYYETRPSVLTGDIRASHAALVARGCFEQAGHARRLPAAMELCA